MSDNVNDRGFDPEDYRASAALGGPRKNMKTSQQIAEEMAVTAAKEYYEDRIDRVEDLFIKEIPLIQLIEVARAAAKITSDDTYDDRLEFFKSLGALKATGKAEWL